MDVLMSTKTNIGGKLHQTYCIHIWTLKHTNFSLLMVTLFLTCRPSNTDTLILFSDFNSDGYLHIKFWMVSSSYYWVLYFIFSGIRVFPCLKYVRLPFLFLKLARKSNIQDIYVIRVATVQVQPWEFILLIPIIMPVFRPWALHIIFLILCFSLSIDPPPPHDTYLVKIQILSLTPYTCLPLNISSTFFYNITYVFLGSPQC